jgi:hypothetical protein
VASLHLGLYPSTDIALSATAPGVSTLPSITAQIGTPTRLTTDSLGNIYATDPGSRSIVKYNSAGIYVNKFVTSKNGTGVAIAQNNDLLVTQGTYVAVINPANGAEKSRFGTFTYANGITVDPSGNIYVTDGRANNVKKFNASYTLLFTSSIALARPSGIAYEKLSNTLYVANSLSGNIQVINASDLSAFDLDLVTAGVQSSIGAFGYDPLHATVKFTYPQGVSFEYNAAGTALDRIYVSDSYQSTVQVLDGVTRAWLTDIGGYGYIQGKLFVPSDVLLDQFSPTNRRLFVASGGGNLAAFGIDYGMKPTFIQVTNPTLNSLTVSWLNPTVTGYSRARIYRSTTSGLLGSNITEIASPGTTYTDPGLTAGTPYYYTVRAVDTGNAEYNNTQQVSGTTLRSFNLALATIGSGTINGTASCGENANCPTNPVTENTLVTLTANPNALKSVFTGWTGDCAAFGSYETCQLPMDAAKSVTATFTAQKPFHVDGYFLDTLQNAYNTAQGSGSIIEIMAGTWPLSGGMTADRAITISIKGGYDSSFNDPPSAGTTVITGRVNVKAGKIIMNNVKIKP